MRSLVPLAFLLAMLCAVPQASAARADVRFIKFPEADIAALGQIDKLSVKVACSWISGLSNVPELYDIQMGYDMPTRDEFQAVPRLGAAAVDLHKWNGVIGILVPSDQDRRSCFSVTAAAEGRGKGVSVVTRQWSGNDLGF